MQYVKVTASTHAEALKKLRESYGPEAIIFEESEIQPKSLLSRAIGKKQYQIQAAIREKKKTEPAKTYKEKLETLELLLDKNTNTTKVETPETKPQATLELQKSELFEKIEQLRAIRNDDTNTEPISAGNRITKKISPPEELIAEPIVKAEPQPFQNQHSKDIDKLYSDIKFIKDHLAKLSYTPGNIKQQREFEELNDYMLTQGFSENFVKEFITQLRATIPENEWKLKKRIYVKAKELFMSRIMANPTLGAKRVVALLGPTGVGKTTTVAKIAARLQLKEKMQVSLVTLDNFRIAATEQLKVYGNIMDIPVAVCKEPQKFKELIDHDPSDIILVDTTGMSQNNANFISTLGGYFAGLDHLVEKHLVISATSKPSDAESIMNRFDVLNIDRIILTKLDETTTYGAYIEIAERWHRPFSFLTNGQKVPDDYTEADRKFLAEKVLEGFIEGLSYSEQKTPFS